MPYNRRVFLPILLLFTLAPASNGADKFYTYVGDLGINHVLLAWGTMSGSNTIGRSSNSHGKAEITVGPKTVTETQRNWVRIDGLEPDKDYSYEVKLNGRSIAKSSVRTWPVKSEKLRFFVIGDFGTGDRRQAGVAEAMAKELNRLGGDNPVRFVITTGDNIYGKLGLTLRYRDTGARDSEWEKKFFIPYQPVLLRIPFFASPGNHDGNESEARADLPAYLDNLFFPSPEPARYYRFNYGGLVDFFSLDTTTNSDDGSPRPIFLKDGDEHKWLEKNLASSQVPWKIPYFHHPPFNAGPRHPSSKEDLGHFMELFQKNGVRVVFTGHEHNFQFTTTDEETKGIRYVISGAGGELRTGSVRSEMARASMEGWAAVAHFLSVEIDGNEMRITPVSDQQIVVQARDGKTIDMPLKVTLK